MERFANNSSTTLSSSINNSVTSLDVASGSTFPSAGNFRIMIGTEIMKVTAVSGSTWTIVRGSEGTTAASHTAGDAITHILTQDALIQIRADTFMSDTIANQASHVAEVPGNIYIPTDQAVLARSANPLWDTWSINSAKLSIPFDPGTWVNQGSAALDVSRYGIFMDCVSNGNAHNHRMRVKSYTAPVAGGAHYYRLTIGFRTHYSGDGTGGMGLVFRNSTSGKFAHYGHWAASNGRCLVETYNSPSVQNLGWRTINSAHIFGGSSLIWFRITDNGTNVLFSHSVDGFRWIQVQSLARTITDAGGFDQAGITVDPYNQYLGMEILSLLEEIQ